MSLKDEWNKRLFVAICNKHRVNTYRYKRQKYTTTMVRIPRSLMDKVLWPEYTQYAASLHEFICSITNELISKIHKVEEHTILNGDLLPGR